MPSMESEDAPMSADDLLHRVDVRRICPEVQQQFLDIIRQVIREELGKKQDSPTGALRTREAAAYMGLKRTKFLEELENDPILKAAEIRMGRARAWLREAWIDRCGLGLADRQVDSSELCEVGRTQHKRQKFTKVDPAIAVDNR